MLACGISGESVVDAVVSKKSGHVFERRLAEKYVGEHGKCPATGEPLSIDDLLPLRSSNTTSNTMVRPPGATSVSGLLRLLQSEWDAVLLETHGLRQQYHAVRQELSNALYQHDAAKRVIARLVKERDQARDALAALDRLNNTVHDSSMDVDHDNQHASRVDQPKSTTKSTTEASAPQLSEDVLHFVSSTAEALMKLRRKRTMPEGLASAETLATLAPVENTSQHHSSAINAIDVFMQRYVASAGSDKVAHVYDMDNSATLQSVATLKAHTKAINDIVSARDGSLILTASDDKSVRLWRPNNNQNNEDSGCPYQGTLKPSATFKFNDAILDASLHPGQRHCLSITSSAWSFSDLSSGDTLASISTDNSTLSRVQFHPDGVIFGVASTTAPVQIWDIKSQTPAFTCPMDTATSFDSPALAFSENGWLFATSDASGVSLWDLRKLVKYKHFAALDDVPCRALSFDYSGSYLAMAIGSGIRIVTPKQGTTVVSVDGGHGSGVNDVVFANDRAEQVLSCGRDKVVRVYKAT